MATATRLRGEYSGTILEIKRVLGIQAQNRTKRALVNLTRKKQILGYDKSEWLSPEDIKGIDFYVYSLSDREIPIQVKTHYEPGEREKYLKHHIQPIEIKTGEQIKQIEWEILEIIKREEKKM